MQFIDGGAVDVTEYQPFLGTSTTTEAEITANDLTIDLDMGADLTPYTATAADRDGAILASGYIQPQMSEDYGGVGSVFCSMIGYDATFAAYLGAGGGGDFIFGLQTDTISRDTAVITDHVIGDVYAWGLWSGYRDGTAVTKLYIVRMRDGATYECDYATAIMFPHRIVIGADENKINQADSIISAVTVEAMEWNDCAAAVDRLGNNDIADIFRRSAGRWYHLTDATQYNQFSRQEYGGSLLATELRPI